MFKRMIAIIVVTLLVMSAPVSVYAEDSLLTRKSLKVVKVGETGDYVYFPEDYSEEAQLMPVSKGFLARFGSGSPRGYADGDGKIKIPIRENWTYAGKFVNGLAVIYDEQKKLYAAIDTTGKVIFDFDEDATLSGVGDSFSFQILENDPHGMRYATVRDNGNAITKTDKPTLTLYDGKGNRIKKELPFYRIGQFSNGVANLYMLKETTIMGDFGNSPMYNHEYEAVASMNTKGEIFNFPVEEHPMASSENTFGFSVEHGDNYLKIIRNSKGQEIYRYTNDSHFDDHYFINEVALLVPVQQADGTTAHTLMDANGNLYPEYQFNDYHGFGGAYGNRFIIRPYLSYAEKVAYAKKQGAEGEGWLRDVESLAEGRDLIIYDLQPYCIYEVQEIAENAIPASVKIVVNGKGYTVPAYNIRGENFLRIRDIASLLRGTPKEFSVAYNPSLKSVILASGEAYEMTGEEMGELGAGHKEAKASKQKLILNGVEISPILFLIDGSNYVRLRDMAQLMNFQIQWEEGTKTVIIHTEQRNN